MNILTIVLTFVVCAAILTSCEKNVDKLTASNFYGAWKSVYDTNDTRIMLFIENNSVYTNASTTDAIIILQLTSSDTVYLYEGSFEITEGYLRTYNDFTNYANEIISYKRKSFALYSETAPDFERVYEKTETDLLETAP